jgi:prefoldin subunit 5
MSTNERLYYHDRLISENQTKNNAYVESLRNEDDAIKKSVQELSSSTSQSFESVNQNISTINQNISRIDQNIGTVNSLVSGLENSKISKTDVANDFTVTTEGKVADARTVKVLNDKFKIVRRIFSITLAENAYCKPFSYFGSYDISADIATYGFPIGVYLYTSASVPMACYHSDGAVRMASGEASNTLVVDYLNGGYQ